MSTPKVVSRATFVAPTSLPSIPSSILWWALWVSYPSLRCWVFWEVKVYSLERYHVHAQMKEKDIHRNFVGISL